MYQQGQRKVIAVLIVGNTVLNYHNTHLQEASWRTRIWHNSSWSTDSIV